MTTKKGTQLQSPEVRRESRCDESGCLLGDPLFRDFTRDLHHNDIGCFTSVSTFLHTIPTYSLLPLRSTPSSLPLMEPRATGPPGTPVPAHEHTRNTHETHTNIHEHTRTHQNTPEHTTTRKNNNNTTNNNQQPTTNNKHSNHNTQHNITQRSNQQQQHNNNTTTTDNQQQQTQQPQHPAQHHPTQQHNNTTTTTTNNRQPTTTNTTNTTTTTPSTTSPNATTQQHNNTTTTQQHPTTTTTPQQHNNHNPFWEEPELNHAGRWPNQIPAPAPCRQEETSAVELGLVSLTTLSPAHPHTITQPLPRQACPSFLTIYDPPFHNPVETAPLSQCSGARLHRSPTTSMTSFREGHIIGPSVVGDTQQHFSSHGGRRGQQQSDHE